MRIWYLEIQLKEKENFKTLSLHSPENSTKQLPLSRLLPLFFHRHSHAHQKLQFLHHFFTKPQFKAIIGTTTPSSTLRHLQFQVRVAFLFHEIWWCGLFLGSKGWVRSYDACTCFVVKEICENKLFLKCLSWFQICPSCSMLPKWCMIFVLCCNWCGWVEDVEIYAFGALGFKNVNFNVVTYAASNLPR